MPPDSEELFRALFEGASDVMIVVDDEGKIVIANEACSRLLGYAPEDLEGKPVELLVPTRFAGHARVREEFQGSPRPRVMGQGMLLKAAHADGHEIAVDIALTPVTFGGRKWTACALRDMRGRTHGPEMLRVQATALRSAANGIVITDRAGWITWVNPAACAITGYQADELVGNHTRLLKSGQHSGEFYANIWKTISRGETWSGTIVNRRKDGTLYHEEQTIAPVVNETGAVTHFIAIKQDVTARRRNEEALTTAHAKLGEYVVEIESLNRRLREEALRDPLTDLHNRRFFEEAAARDVARSIRRGEPLSVAMLDIDHFKSINDTHGHTFGDQVLRRVADILRAGARASDLLCRFGGEEFVAVLSGASLAHAVEIAEQWRTSIAAARVDTGSGSSVGCTISIGVAQVSGDQTDTVDLVLQRADGALYEAKRRGRDRVVSANTPPVAL
jgi:diguanylate cyclase (GGDEF)-like protein/PAS domain S-box-containing protein